MPSQVNFEGNQIPTNSLPSDAICIAGVWYCDPSKVPKEYRIALLRFPSVQKDMMENKQLSPEVEEAIRLRAERVKKKQKQSQAQFQEQHTEEVVAHVDTPVVDTSVDTKTEKAGQTGLVNLPVMKKKKN